MMKKWFLFFAVLVNSCSLYASPIHVNLQATGANDGTTWTNAFTDLQAAIAAAIIGDEIWVAAGVYKPTATTNRSVYFVLPSGVKIYGGFNGTETQLNERDYANNVTILSGDIGQTGLATDNSYHVVYVNDVNSATRLDGFKIISGRSTYSGGGLNNADGSPTIANCIFTGNYASDKGGALYHDTGNLTLLNCEFSYNNCESQGGAIYMYQGTLNVFGCNISNNENTGSGAAMYLFGGIINVDRCIISGNTGSSATINIYESSTLYLTNSLITGNYTTSFPVLYTSLANNIQHKIINCTIAQNRGVDLSTTAAVITNSASLLYNNIIYGNSGVSEISPATNTHVIDNIIEGGYGSGNNNYNSDPLFIQPALLLQAPFDAAGFDYHVTSLSPAIDRGSNSHIIPIYDYDLDSADRIFGNIVDLGAYEIGYCPLSVNINASSDTAFCAGEDVILSASSGNNYLWSNGATTSSITVTQAGTYSVLAADNGGCRGSAMQEITVLTASVQINGNTLFCQGENTTLTAAGSNSSYLWNNGATTNSITVTAAGSYSVTATGTNGCTATESVSVTIAPDPHPVISFTSPSLGTTSFSSYQWSLNGQPISGATTSHYTPTVNGSYTVTVTNSSGCEGTSNPYVLTNIGITESDEDLFILYPNPGHDVICLETELPQSLYQITDIYGKRLIEGFCNSKVYVDIRSLDGGIYFITVFNKNKKAQRKFIKE